MAAEAVLTPPRRARRGGRGNNGRLRRVVLGEKVWLSMGCIALLIRLPFSIASPYFLAATVSRLKDGDAHGVWRNLVYLGAVGVVDAALDFWCVFLFSYTKSRIVKVSQTHCVLHRAFTTAK